MKTSTQSIAAALLGILTLIFSSCSNDSALLQSVIPADSKMVMSVDGLKLFEAMGWEIADDQVVLPDNQKHLFSSANALKDVASLATAIDYAHIYLVSPGKAEPVYILFESTDVQRLEAILKSKNYQSAQVEAPFTSAFDLGGRATLLIRESTCWVVAKTAQGAAQFVASEIESAKKSNFCDVKGVADNLADGNEMIRIVITRKAFESTGTAAPAAMSIASVYATVDVDNSNSVVMNSKAYDRNGNLVTVDGLQKVDTAMLRYVPAGCNFGVAAGVTPAFDWKSVFAAIQGTGDFQMILISEALKPYLTSVNGTFGFFGKIPSGDDLNKFVTLYDTTGVDMILFAQLDAKHIGKATDAITDALTSMGMTPKADGTLKAVEASQFRLYYGQLDGYLVVATRPLVENSSSDLNRLFADTESGAFLRIANPAADGIPFAYGFEFDITGSSKECDATMKLIGTTEPIVPTIVSTMMNI